jgi:hypothetical protein
MVGFGSSLRLARRSGWEDGYFDYETLKLLLSQIEAVYEEGEDQADRYRHDGAENDEESWYHPDRHNPHSFLRQDPFGGRRSSSTGAATATTTTANDSRSSRRLHRNRRRKHDSTDEDEDAEELGNAGRHRRHHHHGRRRRDRGADPGGTAAASAPVAASSSSRIRVAAAATTTTGRDFREDIFLESDSDLEFAGSDEWGLRDDLSGGGAGLRRRRQQQRRQRLPSQDDEQHLHRRNGSQDVYDGYEDEDDDDDANAETSDTGEYYPDRPTSAGRQYYADNNINNDYAPSGNELGTSIAAAAAGGANGPFYSHPYPHNAFYMENTGGDRAGDGNGDNLNDDHPSTYYMESSSMLGGGGGAAARGSSSIYYTYDGESLSLTPPHGVSMYPRTEPQLSSHPPPQPMKRVSSTDSTGRVPASAGTTSSTTASFLHQPTLSPLTHASAMVVSGSTATGSAYDLPPHPRSTPNRHGSAKKGRPTSARSSSTCFAGCGCAQACRQRARRRRRRALRARLMEREKRVPRYLRVAHARARDITERFLGKIRAETEKVLLFAEARLGELADTIGSLRFPSDGSSTLMEGSFMGRNLPNRRALEYPLLAEGGMHPSSSSSDDEGFYSSRGAVGGARDGVAWSDSSDSNADRKNRAGSTQRSAQTKATASDDRGVTRGGMGAGSRAQLQRTAFLSSAKRQIAHYAEIRNSRPTFQRNDHILGEDLLFLSAIEEADGFTAVGVELMHVLRYICINLIAVRKICKRHDRLLMNRMLGGYYHRIKGNAALTLRDSMTLGGLLAQASGDTYETHPTLIGHLKHFKLEGLYDKKIQKLANSRTLQVISSCLALALSEYEVRRRCLSICLANTEVAVFCLLT